MIIGAKGATRKRIEGETRTEIRIPKYGASDDVVILGAKRDSVCLARQRIDTIVLNTRQKQRPTHFNCVKICNQTIKDNCIKFKVKYLISVSNVVSNYSMGWFDFDVYLFLYASIEWDYTKWTNSRAWRSYVHTSRQITFDHGCDVSNGWSWSITSYSIAGRMPRINHSVNMISGHAQNQL